MGIMSAIRKAISFDHKITGVSKISGEEEAAKRKKQQAEAEARAAAAQAAAEAEQRRVDAERQAYEQGLKNLQYESERLKQGNAGDNMDASTNIVAGGEASQMDALMKRRKQAGGMSSQLGINVG